ncbi:MAG: hypothetical protein PHP25_01835 [Candidatus Moranbacteria bacterium]|nr:hypothetical protein [Candidatus Moranbacteria bacterium]
MSWSDDLRRGVEEALQKKGGGRIAVHTRAQEELGRTAANRLAPKYGAYAGDVEFELIPKDMRGTYPVGTILAS